MKGSVAEDLKSELTYVDVAKVERQSPRLQISGGSRLEESTHPACPSVF